MASKKEIEQGLFVEQDAFDKEIKGSLKEKNIRIENQLISCNLLHH